MRRGMRKWLEVWSPVAALGLAALGLAVPAVAALRKYIPIGQSIANAPNVSPNPDVVGRGSVTIRGPIQIPVALIDEAVPSAPVLRKLLSISPHVTTTVLVPGLSSSLFLSLVSREGPGILAPLSGHPTPTFTGTGATAAGSQIAWGLVTGWTHTGSVWCNSSPGIICTLAMWMDEATSDPRFNSEFYDLGTWFFHGTGFTSAPYIDSYNTNNFGNNQRWLRGISFQDAAVPALPGLGVGLLAASLLAGGWLARERRG